MIRDRLTTTLLAAALVASLPLAAAAQGEPAAPEDVDWALTSYVDRETGEIISAPFGSAATLRLSDGIASGSGGCNQFSGDYRIDGSSLNLGEEMTVTLALCDDDVQAVEDAYLAALGDIDGWTIDRGVLELSDDFGEVILTFEVPHILWTTGQVADLLATIDRLEAELAALRAGEGDVDVVELSDRVRALEGEDRRIKRRVTALEDEASAPKPTPRPDPSTSFSAAEKVLLEGVPARIANYCSPLRTQLPRGTRAAVTCQPKTNAVANLSYYLMEGDKAAAEFGRQMTAFRVPEVTSDDRTCATNVKTQRYLIGKGWQAEGCYRQADRAELRFVDNATDCRQLKVGGGTLKSPTFFITVQGTERDISKAYGWATRNLDEDAGQLTSITQPIERPKAAISPSCPT